jgi:hypothetical protein
MGGPGNIKKQDEWGDRVAREKVEDGSDMEYVFVPRYRI